MTTQERQALKNAKKEYKRTKDNYGSKANKEHIVEKIANSKAPNWDANSKISLS